MSRKYPDETDFEEIATYMYYLSNALANSNNRVFVVYRRSCLPRQVNYNILDL